MIYLKPDLTDQEVYNIIYKKIKFNIPYCLTRFGDGEIYFLNNNIPEVLQQKICRLWNFKWPSDFPKVYKEINLILQYAMNNSDLIGILYPNNPICNVLKYDQHKWSIQTSKITNNNYRVCDHQITRNKLFGDIHSFKPLIQDKPIHIITPNVEQLKFNKIDCLLDVDVSYTLVNNDRLQMLSDIKNIKESIVLFGASIYGKDIGAILKGYGKIALDMGATLDAWGGLISRPWFNSGSLQSYCLINSR